MISGLSGSHSAQYAQYAAMAKQIDTDQDGQVSKTEFVDGAPQGVSADAAANLFDMLDTKKTGSIQESDLASAFSQLSDATRSLLIQQQQAGQQGNPTQHIADMFAKLDTDSDGTLSRDEFVAGRPEGISEEDAGKLFDDLSSAAGVEDGEGLTQAQFAQGIEANRPQGGGRGGKSGGNSEEAFDELDTNKDGIVSLDEFLAGKPENVSEEDAKSLFDKLTDGDSESGLTKDQFVSGIAEQGPPPKTEEAKADDQSEMLKQLLAMLQSEDKSARGSANGSSATSMSSLEQFVQAMKAYQSASQQAYAASIVSTVQAAA